MLTLLYRCGVALRNSAYDIGLFRTHRILVPVVSVGNIAVGGTGKTPLAVEIASRFLARGIRTAYITRGYGRSTRGTVIVSDGSGNTLTAREGGDEPVLAAGRLSSLVVIADEMRVRGCRIAVERFQAKLLVLDDAFQHRACARDADIVAVDAERDPFRDRLFPAGRLREPVASLRRADAVVLTKCRDMDTAHSLAERLSFFAGIPVFCSRFEPEDIRLLRSSHALPVSDLEERRLFSFCGIASPAAFLRTLADMGVHVVAHREFPDHYPYTARDVTALLSSVRTAGAEGFITTEKDAVRLDPLASRFESFPVYYPRMTVRFEGDAGAFYRFLDERFAMRWEGR
ncbi:MAG: tetraacyldisaccharide 4'-kinase [Bacteroidota bacterium]|nr:tetraacyldisaccharide 4'-kinase [Bacteroidota bacterium]